MLPVSTPDCINCKKNKKAEHWKKNVVQIAGERCEPDRAEQHNQNRREATQGRDDGAYYPDTEQCPHGQLFISAAG